MSTQLTAARFREALRTIFDDPLTAQRDARLLPLKA
jgi:hypothetical protein